MRIYVPLTADDLSKLIEPRVVHAVTSELRRAVPHEDDEGYEMIATLAAADDSLRLLAQQPDLVRRRLVCVAEVPNSSLQLPEQGSDLLPTAVHLEATLDWSKVESIHLDEEGGEALVQRAIDGDEQAFIESGDIELLWFDVSERLILSAQLTRP